MVRSNRSSKDRRAALLRLSLLCGSAILIANPALAQVEITTPQTSPVQTSTAGEGGTPSDVTITTDGSVVLTDNAGPAVILDSDNDLTINGNVSITDVDDATGILLEGGADRNFLLAGDLTVDETFEAADTDDDRFTDTPAASGSGRTGILISGASPFQGNVSIAAASDIIIEGNESFAIDLSNTPVGVGLDGDMTINAGSINVRGDDSAAIRTRGGITGDLISTGAINVQGVGSSAFDIGGDIDGGFSTSGPITNNGFRFATRAGFNPDAQEDRLDLDAEDLGAGGPAIKVSANVGRGVNLTNRFETTTDQDGNEITTLVGLSAVSQIGSAPAILLDGEGSPIMIGTVSPITDPSAEGYDENLLYGFINLGTISASGVNDDFDATVLSVADATIEGGIRNTNTMESATFVGAVERTIEGVDRGTGLSRVIVLGDNAIAERIQNSGLIRATVSEAVDEVYFDRENLPEARPVVATAIDVGENASLESLINDGTISAILTGRLGTATAINDASGTLTNIVNRGAIFAAGTTSDTNDSVDTDFTLVAMDLSSNTSGVSILQEQGVDLDPDDGVTPLPPQLIGEVRLGSGDDRFESTSGLVVGDIDFGAGQDTLALTDTFYSGGLTNEDGLDIEAVRSTLIVSSDQPIDITSASFDGGSNFSPTIDGATGLASTLQATGAINFANGATITPIFTNLFNEETTVGISNRFDVASSPNLDIADLAAINAADDGSFLFDSSYDIMGDTLVVTVDLREASTLGLDPTQLGSGESVFDATIQALRSNTPLGDQIANLATAGEFYAAYSQLLPEFAAASRQFVIANSDGAIGAVGNHLDSARRSQDKPGGAWVQQFAYFADRDLAGLSEQYRGSGFGFTGGLDKAMGPFHAVGLNLGFASTEIEDVVGVDEPLDVTTVLAGLYAGYESGNLGVDVYAGGGWNSFEQNRVIQIGNYASQSLGEWTGTHLTGNIRAGYDIDLGGRFWARPVMSLDYLRLAENGYTETGELGVALQVGDRTSESASVTGLINLGAAFKGQRTWIRPSVRFGYRQDFLSDGVVTDYQFANIANALSAQTTSADFPSSGVLLGFSIAAGSEFSSVGFDFDSDIRDGFIRHTGRIVVRLLF